MSKDEQDTLALFRINRETHKKRILEYGRQFLKEMGDGILASFKTYAYIPPSTQVLSEE